MSCFEWVKNAVYLLLNPVILIRAFVCWISKSDKSQLCAITFTQSQLSDPLISNLDILFNSFANYLDQDREQLMIVWLLNIFPRFKCWINHKVRALRNIVRFMEEIKSGEGSLGNSIIPL